MAPRMSVDMLREALKNSDLRGDIAKRAGERFGLSKHAVYSTLRDQGTSINRLKAEERLRRLEEWLPKKPTIGKLRMVLGYGDNQSAKHCIIRLTGRMYEHYKKEWEKGNER